MVRRAIFFTLFAVTSILASSAALADEIFANTLSAHFSAHFTEKQERNNVNPGLLYLFNNRVVTGAFLNTHKKMSFFAGYYTPFKSTHLGRYKLTPGFITGAATGYEGGITYGPIPTVTLGMSKRWDLHLTITPIPGGVASLAFGYKL
jgi:hypothetical protein